MEEGQTYIHMFMFEEVHKNTKWPLSEEKVCAVKFLSEN